MKKYYCLIFCIHIKLAQLKVPFKSKKERDDFFNYMWKNTPRIGKRGEGQFFVKIDQLNLLISLDSIHGIEKIEEDLDA